MTDYKVKMDQIRFRLGLRPRSGAYSAPPDALAGIKGATSRQGAGMGKRRERGGEGDGGGSGGEGKGGPPSYC